MDIKEKGQVFTPSYIVDFMLNEIGYTDEGIDDKKILEPSAGDGNFLLSIIRRIMERSREKKFTKAKILKSLKNVFAIEIDEHHYDTLLKNIKNEIRHHFNNEKLPDEDIKNFLKENIVCGDSLKHKWNHEFDYVIGNPPYIRIHNLDKSYLSFLKENFVTMKKGNVDIYYAFYEKSISELKEDGKLILITPNSFLLNSSGFSLRNLIKNKIINLYNFESFEIFKGISTYNAIILLGKKDSISSRGYFPKEINNSIDKKEAYDVLFHNGKIVISRDDAEFKKIKSKLNFKNSIATLSDKIFIHDVNKVDSNFFYLNDGTKIEKNSTKKITKASTYSKTNNVEKFIIFPYSCVGDKIEMMTEPNLKKAFPNTYSFLLKNKKALMQRSLDRNSEWYSFGRSQALTSVLYDKVVIKSLIKDKIDYFFIPKGEFVYSGLYSNVNDYESESKILKNKKLINYLRTYGQDKRGGYKTINATILREILNYK